MVAIMVVVVSWIFKYQGVLSVYDFLLCLLSQIIFLVIAKCLIILRLKLYSFLEAAIDTFCVLTFLKMIHHS